MNLPEILGKKVLIEYTDIGTNFYSKVSLYVEAATKVTSFSTTETKLMLSNSSDRLPPYVIFFQKGTKLSEPRVFLPWVNTDDPNDCFVPCKITLLE